MTTCLQLTSGPAELQIGRPVLLGIEATAIDVAGAPEQQVAPEIDEVVLHEVRAFLETKGREILAENALGRVDGPRRVPGRGDLVQHIGKSLRQRRNFVGFVRNEIDLLRARSNRMRALPQHVPADLIRASGTAP